jgi:hypothetical protein
MILDWLLGSLLQEVAEIDHRNPELRGLYLCSQKYPSHVRMQKSMLSSISRHLNYASLQWHEIWGEDLCAQ